MDQDVNCLICYKNFRANAHEQTLYDNKKFYQVFCKYIDVEVECEEPFCDSCLHVITTLYHLNAEIEQLSRLTSRIAAKCTLKIIESYSRVGTSKDGSISKPQSYLYHDDESAYENSGRRPVNWIRECIFRRYNPQVMLNNIDWKCRELDHTNQKLSVEDDDFSYHDPVGGDGGSDSDGEELAVTEAANFVEAKLSVPPQKNHPKVKSKREEPSGKHQFPGGNSTHAGTTHLYRDHPFRVVGDKFQCLTCGHLRPSLPHIRKHIRTHSQNERRQSELGQRSFNKLVEIGPNKFLYANKFPICVVAGKFRCPLCARASVNKYKLVQHIRENHLPKLVTTGSTESHEHNALNPDSIPETSEEVQESSINDEPIAATNENSERDLPVTDGANKSEKSKINASSNDDEPELKLPDPYETGFANPDLPVEDVLPLLQIDPEGDESAKVHIYTQISPGKFLYANEYEFEKFGENFQCNSCGKTARKKKHMVEHVKNMHYRKGTKDAKPNNSWKQIESDKFMYANEYIIQKVDGRFHCDRCSYHSKGKYKLMEHIRTTHINPSGPLVCEVCGKCFGRRDLFNNHKRIHETAEKKFTCSICGEEFSTRPYLNNHRRIHQGDEKKNFLCNHCGKKFMCKSKLLSHVAQHDGEKRFECRLCGELFLTYNIMFFHRKSCTGNNAGENKFLSVKTDEPTVVQTSPSQESLETTVIVDFPTQLEPPNFEME